MVFSLNTRLFDPELSEAYVCIHGTFDWDVNSKLKIISVFVLREKVRQVYYYCDFFFFVIFINCQSNVLYNRTN